MKHLLCKVWSLLRRCYFHLGVIVTLGLRDEKDHKKEIADRNNQQEDLNYEEK